MDAGRPRGLVQHWHRLRGNPCGHARRARPAGRHGTREAHGRRLEGAGPADRWRRTSG